MSVRITLPPDELCSGLGVVLLPPFGYELSSSYRTLRRLAEELAARGACVMRVDYTGTGDSAGPSGSVSLSSLREALPACAAALRSWGMRRVTAAGLLLGGLLALMDGGASGCEEVLAWAPVLPGRRYTRSLTLLGEKPSADSGLAEGDVLVGGYLMPSGLLSELATLSPNDLELAGVSRVVFVERDDKAPRTPLIEAVATQVTHFELLTLPGLVNVVDVAAEDALIPETTVKAIAAAVTTGTSAQDHIRATSPTWPVAIPVGPGLTEAHVTVGERESVGVLTRAAQGARRALVFLNSGSDPHYGPSRAWVDLARMLASPTLDVLRLDFSGWGESPQDDRATGRPYDQHVVDDIEAVSAALHQDGYSGVVFAGLCASAWMVLRAARVSDLKGDAVIALNPQLYWEPGDPVEALMTDTRNRRAEEIAEIQARSEAGDYDAEFAAGIVCDAGRWLQELNDADISVTLLFGEGDDGLQYLRQRMGRHLKSLTEGGRLVVVEMVGVDHSMSLIWKRPQVAATMRVALAQPNF